MKKLIPLCIGACALLAACSEVRRGAAPTTRATPSPPPAETKIAFARENGENSEIWVMNAGGSGQTRLTRSAAYDMAPDWSTDGGKILFAGNRDSQIYVMNADGTGQTRLTNIHGWMGVANWSPDGTKIVFHMKRHRNLDVYAVNADGTGLVRLTSAPGPDADADWSPDGRRIVFTSVRDGNPELYATNADGTAVTRLTRSSKAAEGLPAWSPDGDKIAFVSNRDGNEEIYVMNADGTSPTRLTHSGWSDTTPAWSRDGTKIAFASGRDGNGEIYVMNADGTVQRRVTRNKATDWFPDWSPGQLGAGKLASSPEDECVEHWNAPWMAAFREITAGLARDQTPIPKVSVGFMPDGACRLTFPSHREGPAVQLIESGADEWRFSDPSEVQPGPWNASADAAGYVTLDADY